MKQRERRGVRRGIPAEALENQEGSYLPAKRRRQTGAEKREGRAHQNSGGRRVEEWRR